MKTTQGTFAAGNKFTPTTPLQLTWTTVMSQDLITTATIPVDAVSPRPVAVFTNPASTLAVQARTEALVVANPSLGSGAGSQLCHVARNSNTDAGWSLVPLFGGRAAKEVAAGTAYPGSNFSSVYGHFTDESGLYFTQLGSDGATWSEPQQTSQESVSNLRVAYSPNGLLVIYGNTAAGDLFTAYQQQIGGPFVGTVTAMDGNLGVGDFHLAMTDETNWQLAANVNGKPVLYTGQLGTTEPSSGPAPVPEFEGTLKQIVMSYWSDAQQTLLYLLVNDEGSLHIWATNSANSATVLQQIPNSNVARAAGHVSSDGSLHVYSTDDNQGLWVLHQDPNNPWNDDGTPNWSPYIPLDKNIAGVASDMSPASTPNLFALNSADYSLRLHAQDEQTQLWRSGQVLQDSEEAFETVRFRTEVTLTDANGISLPGCPVTVRVADGYSAAEIWVAGKTYPVNSQNDVALTTDAMGKLTIAVLTTAGMVAPNLVLNATGLAAPITIQPAGSVHNYLAGNGTLNPTNPGGPLPVFDAKGDTLTAATVQGKPLAPAVQNNGQLASVAASAIQHAATIGLGQPTSELAGFHFSLAESGQASFTALKTKDEVDLHVTRLRAAAELSLGSIWGDIEQWPGDVWEGIRHGVLTISEVVVDVAKKVATLAVKIGDRIVQGIQLAIQGLEQAAHFISGVFKMIEADIELVIQWLMALFDFAAIWRTKMAFQEALQTVPAYIKQLTSLGQKAADGWFSKQKDTVDNALDELAKRYAGQTFGNQPNWQQPGSPPSNTTKVAGNATPADFTNNVHHNWLLNKVASYSPSDSSLKPDATPDDPWQALVKNLTAAGTDFISALGEFKTATQSLIQNPKNFSSVAVPDFITMFRKLVDSLLSLTDAILDSFLALVDGAMNGIDALFNRELDLGFLNTLWSWIAKLAGYPDDDKLTVAALLSLLAAFPCTVIYKLIEGVESEPFPTGTLATGGEMKLFAAGAGANSFGFQPTKGTNLAAGILQVLYFIPAVSSTILGTDTPMWITLISLGLSLVMLVLTSGLPDLTALEWGIVGTVVFFLAMVVVPAVGGIIYSLYAEKIDDILANPMLNDVILILTSLYGGLKLIVGAVQDILEAVHKKVDPLLMESRYLLPLPNIFAWLQLSTFRNEPELAPFVIMAGVDFDLIGYVGGGAAEIADAALS
ncbi:MAG TPA: hypothetical protein PLK30_09995 [Blastocatellia bacterium]|nr:hypothetical protein [Blastocatellia bacterium]